MPFEKYLLQVLQSIYVACVKVFGKIDTCEICDLKEMALYHYEKKMCVTPRVLWRIIYLKNIYFDINAYTQQTYV